MTPCPSTWKSNNFQSKTWLWSAYGHVTSVYDCMSFQNRVQNNGTGWGCRSNISPAACMCIQKSLALPSPPLLGGLGLRGVRRIFYTGGRSSPKFLMLEQIGGLGVQPPVGFGGNAPGWGLEAEPPKFSKELKALRVWDAPERNQKVWNDHSQGV